MLVRRYGVVDFAMKVVGVGSVGTYCWVGLLEGRDEDDQIVLQMKQATPSVLTPYAVSYTHLTLPTKRIV